LNQGPARENSRSFLHQGKGGETSREGRTVPSLAFQKRGKKEKELVQKVG